MTGLGCSATSPRGSPYFFSIEIQKYALMPASLWGFELRCSGLCTSSSRLSRRHHCLPPAAQRLVLQLEPLADFATRVAFLKWGFR